MVHASLFTGIGGFDLAAEWMGWRNSFQCEIDPFCQKVLAKNFPDADRYTDIKAFDARQYRGTVDVLSGGFPCQPFSLAGQRKGNQDDRALWPEMLRVIDEVRPRWIVGENVAGLVSLGLDGVLFDLEASGYSVETVLLPACSVGAPHRRDRLWIVAYAGCIARDGWQDQDAGNEPNRPNAGREEGAGIHQRLCQAGVIPNANGLRCWAGESERPETRSKAQHSGKAATDSVRSGCQKWNDVPLTSHPLNTTWRGATADGWRLTEPPLRGPDDGLSTGLVRVSTRAKQLKAYGNSIVPQVAYEIFQALALADAEILEETLSPVTV